MVPEKGYPNILIDTKSFLIANVKNIGSLQNKG